MPDWYPTKLDDIDTWHANFNAQAIASGATYGLTAGALAQIALDAQIVAVLVEYDEQVRGYVEAWTDYRNNMLRGVPTDPLPAPPTNPTLTIPVGAFLPGVEARTRTYANVIKGDLDYTDAVGEDFGIVATTSAAGTPSIKATPVPGTSNVDLKVGFNGHALVAIDLSVAGGPWNEIARVNKSKFTDTTAPTTPDTPEERSYRAQAVIDNVRGGDLSPTVTIVTMC